MNGKQIKRITRIARGLPVVMEHQYRMVKGSVIKEQGLICTAAGGEVLDDKEYRALQPVVADHVEKMKVEYQKHGEKGLNDYCEYVREVAAEDGQQQPQTEYVLPGWFDSDNVHEVGQGYVHYTEDAIYEPKLDIEIEAAINKYLGATDYYLKSVSIDEAVQVRLYIFTKKPWMSYNEMMSLKNHVI